MRRASGPASGARGHGCGYARGHSSRSSSSSSISSNDDAAAAAAAVHEPCYLTYRPLSNLPTPPPTLRDAAASLAPSPPTPTALDDGSGPLLARFRGPAIHLVNLIPSSASLVTASVPLVQAMLCRARLPLETVALAVCVLDSLDAKFARAWRLSCPSGPLVASDDPAPSPPKRLALPPTPLLYQAQQRQMRHIDSVRPELIILAALVIAVKFTEDPQRPTHFYCVDWGKGLWSHDQLNATERCIVESLDYRIMPLCDDDCLADAMVDMQLAALQADPQPRELSPPDSVFNSDDDARTMAASTAGLGGLAPMAVAATHGHGTSSQPAD